MNDLDHNAWRLLESRINHLLEERQQLIDENARLTAREETLKRDKHQLTQVNLQTRSKIEGMLARLKALESAS